MEAQASGFANVHFPVWQHTIGGYQVLHKWLEDRRRAGRSVSQDDITHWLQVYAALEATRTLMLKVDEAIEANGGWPGAFSQNHPPPDAVTLAAEQMAQKDQLKAQKKAATAAGKKATSAHLPMAMSLFDPDDDLDELAAAAGAPPRPKARATPAKAAGGKTSTHSAKADDISDWQAMCAIRTALTRNDALTRVELIREAARELGFARTGARISQNLDGAVRRAVRRGIAVSTRDTLSLGSRGIADYDRAFLKRHLLSVVGGAWCDKADIPIRFARSLGFARTGAKIEDTVWAMMKGLQRAGLVEVEGRGAAACYRKARAS